MKDIWPESTKRLAEHLSGMMQLGLAQAFFLDQPDGFVKEYRGRAGGKVHEFEFAIHNLALGGSRTEQIADKVRQFVLEKLQEVERSLEEVAKREGW